MQKKIDEIVLSFSKNLNDLRSLLKLPEAYDTKAKLAKNKINNILLPIFIKKIEAENKNKKGEEKEKGKKLLNKLIDEYKKVSPENISSKGKLTISIDESYIKSINAKELKKTFEDNESCTAYKINIEKAVLFNLIAYLEQSFAEVSTIILKKHPEILGIESKSLTYEEIKNLNSLEDAKDFLVSEEIEKLLFGSLSGFLGFFENKIFHKKLSDLTNFEDEIIEIKERRNLFVHNDGVVNLRYINSVSKKLIETYKIEKDKQIDIENSYLELAINVIELIGLEIFFYASLKFEEKDDREKTIWRVHGIIYESLVKNSNNFLGENLSTFILSPECDKFLTEMQKDYILLNYWLCLKKIGKKDDFLQKSSSYDTSSKSNIIKLCYYSLIENYKEACKFIVLSLNDEDFDLNDYQTFLILSELRKQKEAIAIIKKYKKEKSLKK